MRKKQHKSLLSKPKVKPAAFIGLQPFQQAEKSKYAVKITNNKLTLTTINEYYLYIETLQKFVGVRCRFGTDGEFEYYPTIFDRAQSFATFKLAAFWRRRIKELPKSAKPLLFKQPLKIYKAVNQVQLQNCSKNP